ncbi:hypothetical protein [Acidovorax sp. LjRoot117]|uniref:hypothetical protein n=1 Tax=Acidovorax sp. LjRoot117 TaxID=3342255 RepID=UPI003ECF65BA
MQYKFAADSDIYTGLHDICSGSGPNKIYAIGKIFQMPDPIEGLVSLLLEVTVDGDRLEFSTIFNAYESITDYYSNFNCIDKDPYGHVYVGEQDGFLLSSNGVNLIKNITKNFPPAGIQYSLYIRGERSAVFGTGAGSIVHVDEDFCKSYPIVPDEMGKSFITAIHGIGSDFMVAVGDAGLIARYSDGMGWQRISPPTNDDLLSVFCLKSNEIYIGSRAGDVWIWDGDERFKKLDVEFRDDKTSICGFAEYMGVLYGAFGGSGIYRLSKDGFKNVPEVEGAVIGRIKITNVGLVGVGSGWGSYCNWFVRFDGEKWNAQRVSIPF